MLPTRQSLSADKGADVVGVDAALESALVLAAVPLLRATLFADRVVSPGRQGRAGQLLVHGAAATENLKEK